MHMLVMNPVFHVFLSPGTLEETESVSHMEVNRSLGVYWVSMLVSLIPGFTGSLASPRYCPVIALHYT